MDPDAVGPMIVMTTLIVTSGAVLLLRPISKRLGSYLELLISERRSPAPRVDTRLAEAIERIEDRLRLLEERQDFTDSLIGRSTARQGLPASRTPAPAEHD